MMVGKSLILIKNLLGAIYVLQYQPLAS